mmetsp:Transcript_2243/g.4440  ORF Transcript_2243/g.4440 Transcript_2243/m.4440 type:complete len:280 (-) Transcript_2243:443-1282(-)
MSKRPKDIQMSAPTNAKKGILAELEERRQQGKLQRVPTYQEPEDDESNESASAPLTVNATAAAKESVPPPPALTKTLPATGSAHSVPPTPPRIPSTSTDFMAEVKAAIAKKESLRSLRSKESDVVAASASKESTTAAPIVVAAASAPPAVAAVALRESIKKEIEENVTPKAESEPTLVASNSNEATTPSETTTTVESTPETKVETTPTAPITTPVEKAREDAAEDPTEVPTDGEDDAVTEETNGLIVVSSASEVEVSAGSGFSLEKFCCGLNLTTASSS